MLKQPGHGGIRVGITSSQQSLLTSDSRETHSFKLRHGRNIELGSGGCYTSALIAIEQVTTDQEQHRDQDPLLRLVDLCQGIYRGSASPGQ